MMGNRKTDARGCVRFFGYRSYVFTGILFSVGPPGGRNLFVLRFYGHSLIGRPSGGVVFLFCVFTGRVRQQTVSDGPIFRCTTKDREERRAKGLRPLESPGVNGDRKPDVLCANHFATVHLTRLSRLRRCRLSPCLCVLRCSERQQHLCNHPTSDYKSGWLFFQCQRIRRSWSSTIESVEVVQKGGPAKAPYKKPVSRGRLFVKRFSQSK